MVSTSVALINPCADIDEGLDRFVVQFRQRPKLRRKGIIHAVDTDALSAGKIFLENRQAVAALGDEILDRRGVAFIKRRTISSSAL